MPTFPIRVYYEDTDFGGRVYYANYLKFAERARTEVLRSCDIEQSALMREHGIGFVVRKCTVDYFKPAAFDDLLTIHTELHDISRASIVMQQTVMRGDEKLVMLLVKLAVINQEGRVARMPEFVLDALNKLALKVG